MCYPSSDGEWLTLARAESREELCRIALAIAEAGVAAPEYIAARLRLPLHRVNSALSLMETFGWVQRVEGDKSVCPCSKCPLRRVCPLPGSPSTKVRIYRVRREILDYCRQLLNSRDK